MENKNAVEIRNLSFAYDGGEEVLHDISTAFETGKITAVVGANGCGKSTLLNIIAGIYPFKSGDITVCGKSISDYKRSEFAKKVATVHQQNTAPNDITVRELVAFGRTPWLKFGKGTTSADEEEIDAAIASAELEEYSGRTLRTLSGGQLQRAWLAAALAQKTEILLLDEITTYLDIYYQLKILNLVKKLNSGGDLTVITVLHDLNQALTFCDNILVLNDKGVLYQGNCADGLNPDIIKNAFGVSARKIASDGKDYYIFS